jgi:hypothetical protein
MGRLIMLLLPVWLVMRLVLALESSTEEANVPCEDLPIGAGLPIPAGLGSEFSVEGGGCDMATSPLLSSSLVPHP